MDKFKEFQGKDLDECIQDSCEYFNCPREKLEIEIVQDAKSGIFGIVGARKAKIRARRAQLPEDVHTLLAVAPETPAKQRHRTPAPDERAHTSDSPEKRAPTNHNDHARQANRGGGHPAKERQDAGRKTKSAARQESFGNNNTEFFSRHDAKKKVSQETQPGQVDEETFDELEEAAEDFRIRPIEELDEARLKELGSEIVGALVRPIAGRPVDVNIEVGHGRVRAKVAWQGDAGLLIGREGQTLCALQYLASRMLSRAMDAALRVQLDIGDYRRRQDDKLCELAKTLAAKARHTGRSYSTRPLSSYHRRIIHMSLQDDTDVLTRSSGDGPLKRVIISPKRPSERA